MRMLALLLCTTLLLPTPARAEEPSATALPKEAVRRLSHIIGEWDSRWEWVTPDGSPRGVETGTEVARYLIGDRVVEVTTNIVGRPHPSKAWMFYGDNDRQFHLISVSGNGDHWNLHGGLDRFVITSDPHTDADGGTSIIRFTHHETDHDHLRADMEHSRDGGVTWTLGFRQHLTRRSAAHSGPSALDADAPAADGD